MNFVQFLIDTPVVSFLLLLGLLVTVVPVVAAVLSRKKSKHPVVPGMPMKTPPSTRFLGTQMDLAILILGLLLLLGVITWVRKNFFG